MKYIYIVSLLILMGCSDSFLNLYPETQLNETIFYASEDEYVILTNGCYIPARDYYKLDFWIVSELPSDNGGFQYNSNGGGMLNMFDIELFTVNSDNSTYQSFWNQSYKGVTYCNKLLFEIERSTITWKTKGYKERCLGEGYFLRALYYFNLVRIYGGVPLVLNPILSQEALNTSRSSEDAVYEQVISDLNQAATYFEQAVNVEEKGRANYVASLSLLGKVYLTTHQYADAESILTKVVNLKKHSLLNNYDDLFQPAKKDYTETIFAIQYSENSQALANEFRFFFAPWTSKGEVTLRPNVAINGTRHGWQQPTNDLIEAFEEGDKRKNASIAFWDGVDWDGEKRHIPYCNKFKPPVSAPDRRCSDNFPVLRYSDVLLMLAESLNEQGKTSEAIPYVKQVRRRAGLEMPVNLDKNGMFDLIEKERQVEFCFENQRWFDLKRTGRALDVMKKHGQKEKSLKYFLNSNAYLLDKYMLLAPIPSEEIFISNGTLEQNPGW